MPAYLLNEVSTSKILSDVMVSIQVPIDSDDSDDDAKGGKASENEAGSGRGSDLEDAAVPEVDDEYMQESSDEHLHEDPDLDQSDDNVCNEEPPDNGVKLMDQDASKSS